MSADRDPIEALLASITDGKPTDWEAAERDVDARERARLASLRELSHIADFNRGLQRGPEDPGMPERWGDLQLLECLGMGAGADVYRAWDAGLKREVALKLMRPGGDDASLLEEGRNAARIRHRHVVTVHGIDRRDGRVGLWMELVRGWTIEQGVQVQGPIDPLVAKRLGVEIGSALTAVHAAGLLHRDIKPANVIRDAEGGYVLADFGLGLRRDKPGIGFTGPSGTPMYMAPELLAGAPASERSDVYSLGLLLWFALAGQHPFEAKTLAELTAAAAIGPRPGLREVRPGVPAPLATIIEQAIAPDPARRFAGPRAMVEALEAWRPAPAPRILALMVGAVALVVLLGVGAFALWRAQHWSRPVPVITLSPTAPPESYAVEASFLLRGDGRSRRLVSGDRVKPGDRLSLEVHATRPAWIYVLDEDERGERYLLFPQPRFDVRNPVPADSTFVLPGSIGGKENAWTVTSPGGREYLLVVVSPRPLPEIEADLGRLPPPQPGRPIEYAKVGEAAVERLRGVGGVSELPASAAPAVARSRAFDRFRALAGRESDVHGVWVRQIVLENPRR